eukprot:gb/GEZN01013134.1/.p1 GENE.gb/GEZN01013134.1/~~gb/GEZN01013134.1/.p1  ORF type:complete len:235 (-),score=21.81 gb/GEZN01013134.1/:297-1001(-)
MSTSSSLAIEDNYGGIQDHAIPLVSIASPPKSQVGRGVALFLLIVVLSNLASILITRQVMFSKGESGVYEASLNVATDKGKDSGKASEDACKEQPELAARLGNLASFTFTWGTRLPIFAAAPPAAPPNTCTLVPFSGQVPKDTPLTCPPNYLFSLTGQLDCSVSSFTAPVLLYIKITDEGNYRVESATTENLLCGTDQLGIFEINKATNIVTIIEDPCAIRALLHGAQLFPTAG